MLEKQKHVKFMKSIMKEKDILYYLTEQDRNATLFWAMNSLKMLRDPYFEEMKPFAIRHLMSCLKPDGGFGPTQEYHSNMLSTFYSLQTFFIMDIPFYSDQTVDFIFNLQNPKGAFMNDKYGETDTRIDCCAILSLHILSIMKHCYDKEGAFSMQDSVYFKDLKSPYNLLEADIFEGFDQHMVNKISFSCNRKIEIDRQELDRPILKEFLQFSKIDVELFVNHLLECNNHDGGFGQIEGSESHAAQIFCCISSLRSLGKLDCIDTKKTVDFLVFRQMPSGGFNGRVNKKEDVCYSFWAYSSLLCLGSKEDIDTSKLKEFILSCQGADGGFSDRPGNEPDLFHLMFSLAALSMLGDESLGEIDPGFAM